MKHTQGKWEAEGRNIVTSRGEFKLVLVNGIGLDNLKDMAQLIASAPELLEACKEIAEHSQDNNTYNDNIIYRVKLAIAKAEGRAE